MSEQDHFDFLLGFAIIYAITGWESLSNILFTFKTYPLDGLAFMIWLILSLWELTACFQINKTGDHQNFLSRYTCLSFAVTLRYVIPYYLGTWGLHFLTASMQPDIQSILFNLLLTLSLVIRGMMYHRMTRSFEVLAHL